jgi:putative spermidine/putrescine transport system ATP-binding protein
MTIPATSEAVTALRDRAGVEVEFRNLHRSFGDVHALDGLDLRIEPGELIALLGPSGCGKTTALRVLAGFEVPDQGEVLVGGADVVGVPANRRDMGMVFQAYSLFPHLNVVDNVAFGLRLRGRKAAERRARAHELLELVGLAEHDTRYPHQLSGGQQQRVALARALAVEPRVLLLDEPLSALDAKVRVQLRDEIRRLQLELGITTVFVTHDQEEALSLADRVGVLRAGRLEQCATPDQLYARPATAFVAEFVGTMNRLPGVLRADGGVDVLDRQLPVLDAGDRAAGSTVDVLVRPEVVDVVAGGTGRVVTRNFHGPMTRLRIALSDGTELLADLPSVHAGDLGPGATVTVNLSDRAVLVADPLA